MKKSDITYQEKLNELRLDISHPNSNGINFIFVEGETDIRLFRKFFDLEKCKVENIPGGNVCLERCVSTLISNYRLIIGIRDADFLRVTEGDHDFTNIFLTDLHDIEITMICHEPILNAMVCEYSEMRLNEHVQFRDRILRTISSISALKWLNDLEELELNFVPGFLDLISLEQQTTDLDQYIDRVLSKSLNAKITSKDILMTKIGELLKGEPDLYQITNGHDLLSAFAKYFKEVEGRSRTTTEMLESSIRMTYDKNAFESSALFNSLVEWQDSNSTQLFKT